MGPIAVSLVTAAAPYVVKGLFSWGSNAVKTWAPSYAAKATIEGSAAAGKQLMGGGDGWLASIGGAAGRVFGWGAAPFVAQSEPVQSGIGLAAKLITPEVVTAGVKGVADITTAYFQNRRSAVDIEAQRLVAQDRLSQGSLAEKAEKPFKKDKVLKYKMQNKLLKDQIEQNRRFAALKMSPYI